MLARNNNLLVKGILLFLFEFGHFLDHVLTRDEHSLEIRWIREGLGVLDLAVEVGLSNVSGAELSTLHLALGLIFLLHVRNHEVIHGGLVGLLGMLIPVCLLAMDVEAGGGLPS